MPSALRLLGLISLLLAAPAIGQGLDDRHLPLDLTATKDRAALVASLLFPADPALLAAAEALPGGAATVPVTAMDDAFSQPSAGMTEDRLDSFNRGNGLFRKLWIAAPSAITASDGLGPLYNTRSCQACHLKDGRGHAPEGPENDPTSMLLRLSLPGGASPEGITEWIATSPDPAYGGQLQDFAAPGQSAEGRLEISYTETPVTLADGTVVSLRAPEHGFVTAQGAPADGLLLSPRIAPQMIGLGLLEAIPAADILALADSDDTNQDGISGRAQIVPSVEFGVPMLGRFGHKAGVPTIREQTAAALAMDMGLGNPLFPDPWGDCTERETTCRTAPHGGNPADRLEIDHERLELLTFYSRNLAVPARRGADEPQVLKGKDIFLATGCAACHQPTFVTHSLTDQPEQSAQLIWPFTDLLLHDMGEGLADNRPEGRATGTEWRTAPLWGIGLTETVSGHSQFLHDGRARSLLEAILWHGGEAQSQRDAVAAMSAEDRAALLAFIASL